MVGSRIPSRTDPVRQLIDEHEIFMAALEELSSLMGSLPEGVRKLSAETLMAVETIWHAVNEHLNVHFVKEEEIFFPFIERMVPGARVKFQFLHVDHDRLRESFELFTEALQELRIIGGSQRGVDTLRMVAADMIRWFEAHILAEDSIYFEIAGQSLSPEESSEVLTAMRSIESRLREDLEEPARKTSRQF